MNFVWSDTHDKHEGIIHICNRPFKTTVQMRRELIKNYNSVISPSDTCYWLGDVYWGKQPDELGTMLRQMNGTKILVLGNHDEMNPFKYVQAGFMSVHTYLKVEEFHMIHDPSAACMDRNNWWLCGHLHSPKGKYIFNNCYDCGVDGHDYTPISFDQIREELKSYTNT